MCLVDRLVGRRALLLLLFGAECSDLRHVSYSQSCRSFSCCSGTSGFGLFANSIYSTATSGALTAVPLFIAMGEILFRPVPWKCCSTRSIGSSARFAAANTSCASCCPLFSALCRARPWRLPDLLGRSLFPAMRKRGYDTEFSAGTILAGASLDPIIPPSVLADPGRHHSGRVDRQDADRRHCAGHRSHRHVSRLCHSVPRLDCSRASRRTSQSTLPTVRPAAAHSSRSRHGPVACSCSSW